MLHCIPTCTVGRTQAESNAAPRGDAASMFCSACAWRDPPLCTLEGWPLISGHGRDCRSVQAAIEGPSALGEVAPSLCMPGSALAPRGQGQGRSEWRQQCRSQTWAEVHCQLSPEPTFPKSREPLPLREGIVARTFLSVCLRIYFVVFITFFFFFMLNWNFTVFCNGRVRLKK